VLSLVRALAVEKKAAQLRRLEAALAETPVEEPVEENCEPVNARFTEGTYVLATPPRQ
jgi:hypothetical protein